MHGLLGRDTRLAMKLAPVKLNQTEFLLMEMLDKLNTIAYFDMASAMRSFRDEDRWINFIDNSPKRIPRPGSQPELQETERKKPEMTPLNEIIPRINAMVYRKMRRS